MDSESSSPLETPRTQRRRREDRDLDQPADRTWHQTRRLPEAEFQRLPVNTYSRALATLWLVHSKGVEIMHKIRILLSTLLSGLLVLGLVSCGTKHMTAQDKSVAEVQPAQYASRMPMERAPARDQQAAPGESQFNTEEYGRITENEFLEASNHPVSTFSIDVDTASYSNVRRFITQGQLPPADAVRIEELINYFKYDYRQPEGDEPFSITTELAACPWEPAHKLIHIGLQGKRMSIENAPANNLVFLIDTSGS